MVKKQKKQELLKRCEATLGPIGDWYHNCHGASLALVNAGLATRVARGWCEGVLGQHSWAVIGNDCYDRRATIIDPTLWSYTDKVDGIYIGTAVKHQHTPHGSGLIWDWGRPRRGIGPVVLLTPKQPLSIVAEDFIALLGPLDRYGWSVLANQAPVQGWPAGEIFSAMDDTKELAAVVPIDKLGMLTDRNPNGLYLPKK